MKALILAAGYATRLYPLTLDRPKPLLEVGGKSIMERLLDKVDLLGSCDAVYIVTNAKFYNIVTKWVKEHLRVFPVKVINDGTLTNEDRIGAIGDIDLVIRTESIDDDLLVMGGDNLFEFDIVDFAAVSRKKKGKLSIAFYDVKDLELAKKYGIVTLDKNKKIVNFQEKPEKPKSTLASTCVYYFPKEVLPDIAEYMRSGNSKDAPGNFIKWMAEKDDAYGYVFSGRWYDIGDINSLAKADEEYKNRKA